MGKYDPQKYKEYRKRESTKLQRWVYNYLKENPCIDCGEDNPIVLEFDHVRGDKRCHPSQLMYIRTIATFEREIAKCEVVCANCHRIRTMTRGNWYRFQLWQQEQQTIS